MCRENDSEDLSLQAAAQIQHLTEQIAGLQDEVLLLQRTNTCLRQENQDLQQGRDALVARLDLLEQKLQHEQQARALVPESEANTSHFAESDRWLLQTSRADYTKLKDLLAAQNWEAADWETQQVMLHIGGEEAQAQGFLSAEQLSEFPCLDLKILNKLWTIYSNGKYGFMVQREIWARTHSTRNLWHNPDMDGYYPRREGLGHTLAHRLLHCALDDF